MLLIVHTCGTEGVVALADESAILAEASLPGRGSSEAILPALRRIFAATGLKPAQLTAVAVVDGPGSFTGVRVGLSTAKGLCEAAACRMVAISRLELVAAQAKTGGPVLALLDAGRGQFFAGSFSPGEADEALLSAAQAESLLAGHAGVTCEASVAAAFAGKLALVEEPGARAIAALARRRIALERWTDVALADANYLRRTDAELTVQAAEGR